MLGGLVRGSTWLAEGGKVHFVAKRQVLHQLDVVVPDELRAATEVEGMQAAGSLYLRVGVRTDWWVWWRIRVFMMWAGITRGVRHAGPRGVRQPGRLTRRPVQLIDLCLVSVNQELVQIMLGRGLVIVPPRGMRRGIVKTHY
jgi:hypothetical protein